MKVIKLPSIPSYKRPTDKKVIRGIVEYDQFDDWVVDPIYLMDKVSNIDSTINTVKKIWTHGEIEFNKSKALRIPRNKSDLGRSSSLRLTPNSRDDFEAMTLPFEIRVCVHSIIGFIAEKIDEYIIRDKVRGFELVTREDNRIFSVPGEGLPKLLEAYFEVAKVEESSRMQILDIQKFNASARYETLKEVLASAGITKPFLDFIEELIGFSERGIPSIDDSFAYLYNFYLSEVDSSLIDSKSNFFRYRDEYFLFDKDSREVLLDSLDKIGLSARLKKDYGSWIDFEEEFQPFEDSEQEDVELDDNRFGRLIGSYRCKNWVSAEELCTDGWELESVTLSKFNDEIYSIFGKLDKDSPIDGVRILPILRVLHSHRKNNVFTMDNELVSKKVSNYQENINNLFEEVVKCVETAIEYKSDWQLSWSLLLLSDCRERIDSKLEQKILGYPKQLGSNELVNGSVGIYLSRRSSIDPDEYWDLFESKLNYTKRAEHLAAFYQYRRGDKKWFERVERSSYDKVLIRTIKEYL